MTWPDKDVFSSCVLPSGMGKNIISELSTENQAQYVQAHNLKQAKQDTMYSFSSTLSQVLAHISIAGGLA